MISVMQNTKFLNLYSVHPELPEIKEQKARKRKVQAVFLTINL